MDIQQTPSASPLPVDSAAPESAASWSAIIVGTVAATAISAMLVTGGSGMGFLSMSPWQGEGASGEAMAIGFILWLVFSQIIAYGVGGYLAGRLRTQWRDAAAAEVHFRDVAHGFLAWALSAVVGVALLGSALGSVVSGTAKAGAGLVEAGAQAVATGAGSAAGSVAGSVAGSAAADAGPMSLDYFTDALLRPNEPSSATAQGDVRQEVSRILLRSAAQGRLTDADQAYLAKVVAQRAGLDEAAARQRITEVRNAVQQAASEAEQKAREAADTARKAAAGLSLWVFGSLLMGAVVATFSAAMGGRARDRRA